jgi:hypothetical protein
MAAGASIYDNIIRDTTPRPQPPMNPLDMMTRATELKTAQARSQMAPIELQRAQEEADRLHQANVNSAQDAADQTTSRQIYGDVQNDATVAPADKHSEFIKRLAGKVNPRTIDLMNTALDTHDAAVRKATDDNLAQSIKANTEVHNQLSAVTNPVQYATARQSLIRQGLAKPEDIPEAYDPDTVAYHKAAAMGATNSATAEIARREQANKDADEKRKANTDELANSGRTIDGVKDQDGYNAWRAGLSPANQAVTAATFSPQNVATIKRMALTADQQREADQATATATETNRHNQAEEALAAKKPTYSGEMRAALVAVGADPDHATPDQTNAALAKLRPSTTDKPATKATLTAIETRKATAIAKSKATLDKETASNTVGGKVTDQPAIDQAWEDHIGRLQDAQTGYENELTTATGGDVGHNDWADRLRVPGKAGSPPPAAAASPAPAGTPPAAASTPNPAAKALVSKYKVGQPVKLKNGQTVTIKSIDPATGNFEY